MKALYAPFMLNHNCIYIFFFFNPLSHVLKIVIRSLGLALYCMLQFEPRGQKVLLLLVYVIYYDLKVENVLNMHPCVGKCVKYAYICIVKCFYSNSNKCTIFDYEWIYVNVFCTNSFFFLSDKKRIFEKPSKQNSYERLKSATRYRTIVLVYVIKG